MAPFSWVRWLRSYFKPTRKTIRKPRRSLTLEPLEVRVTPATFVWDGQGTVHGRVERVEPPYVFAFRWVPAHSIEVADGSLLLVEFTLMPEGERTRLKVIETGFAQLAGSDDERREHFDGHRRGWALELAHLVAYVAQGTQAGP